VKILLIDDEPFALKLLARQLGNLGFLNVETCERARDALALVTGGDVNPDLIFCDLQMPEMDGVEFVRHLVGAGFKGNLVLISGEDERILQTVQKLAVAHRLNVIGALRKPVSTERLQQVLASQLDNAAVSRRAARKTYGADELRRAIANGELLNHYQPQAHVASGAIVGVEALVRWKHPEDGLVFPDQFIATAEEHGLIDDLTRAVLIDSLRQARLWQELGLTLHVSVNISMDNLAALEFPDFVAAAVAEAGIPMNKLILEVTESRLMKDPLASLDILTRLRLRQIGLSIDDFGTGHSSLKQLRDIPFDELKLDRGFVHDACNSASLRAIVDASIGVARQLGMKTVAEGVENEADWEYLRLTPCDLVQGYFIARPMPAEALGPWMEGDWAERRADLVRVKA
jgi:EAL domain-containing protein (putative c-di-GMP-specific phosphodiesterase class I)/CheY-like chemotaxis protein